SDFDSDIEDNLETDSEHEDNDTIINKTLVNKDKHNYDQKYEIHTYSSETDDIDSKKSVFMILSTNDDSSDIIEPAINVKQKFETKFQPQISSPEFSIESRDKEEKKIE
ncbi:hypothetical protein HK096_011420, partial [Nowakowskiella sp. JEL0078]